MKQISFSQVEYAGKKRTTRREVFLAEMERVMPWSEVLGVIEPHYPKGKRGRPPVGLERMLRVYLVQQWYNLSDEGAEDEITDSQALRGFVGIDLSRESAPDATTLLQFRHLLEKHELTKKVFEAINGQLSASGLMMREGTIADATILAAPPSVKNEAQARDPEMHQTKKGNQWYFGMKAHIGVDAESGLVHTVVGTAANVADVTQTGEVLHGEEKTVYLDAGYTGVEKREELKDRDIDWQVAMKRGKLKAVPEESVRGRLLRQLESVKASIRSKVEHPFHIVKNLFHFRKVRYKGLAKNTAQLHMLFGLANLVIAKRRLLAPNGQVAS
ncbi:MAG: IS5 family transposase [Candidatus Accumulibacter sp.]|jgi:IS5 family transposase|uniref:IS5 family transposase n=1 Tax=Accumulibacter sp. TaxID=2053492 RepID=UPI001AC4C5C8|nr:IS5 family transposase [Accumulibacter sp.]MBN8437288.1 IS5 family transposase [Accumulibacter sp.]